MDSLLARHVTSFAEEVLDTFPVMVIQGARQVGKSTLAELLSAGRVAHLVTLDDEVIRTTALTEPAAFVEQAADGVLVIDEVQRAPELLLAIKASVDRNRKPGRFVLTGSSNLLRLPRTPDSLAGRAVSVDLWGMSQGELSNTRDDLIARLREGLDATAFTTDTTRTHYASLIARGGYPEVQTLTPRMRNHWFDSYARRLMERDVNDIAPRVDSGRMASILRLLAANHAGELVKARIARDAGVPETSVAAYLDLLETMYLSRRLRPWTRNLTSRESARPKVFITDPGLAMRLARVTEQQLLPLDSSFFGPAMEGLVVTELLKQQTWSTEEYELFQFRDRDGLEVDVIAELGDGSVMGFEVKSGSTVKQEHLRGLRALRDRLGDRFRGGYVLNASTRGVVLGDRLWSLPVSALWEA